MKSTPNLLRRFGVLVVLFCLAAPCVRAQKGSAFVRQEIGFELPGLSGNPFDYTENDVHVTVTGPGGQSVILPAFFDGGQTWRVRYTPTRPGAYEVAKVTRNGKIVTPAALDRHSFTVTGRPGPGFVRRDPADAARFRFDNGDTYYPLGHNVAWKSGSTPDVAEIFDKMGAAGENWSRVWMNHWDNKNLDWVPGRKIPLGRLDLDVARHWDAIVAAAEKNHVYFQMTLQHHGQYTTRVNPNWNDNPWNAALNGGFLAKPEDFFTNARARALTKAKYRYIIARWGYSPAILAWELFNEVQFTDAARENKKAVADWHREMAAFLRSQDLNRHLVTTSSDTNLPGLYDAMDYVQPHAYPPDGMAAARSLDPATWHKPVFFGEIGPAGDLNADEGVFLHDTLWASLMSRSSGAAQYWTWDHVDRRNLYFHFAAAAGFVKASRLAAARDLRVVDVPVQTREAGTVSFGPGGGWGAAKRTEFVFSPSGAVEGVGEMPSFLQGRAHADLFSAAAFTADLARPGTFAVSIGQSAKAGAHPVILVDGAVVAEREFAGASEDVRQNVLLSANVPAGKHAIRIENRGADWVVINRIALSPFGAALRAMGKVGKKSAVLWLRRAAPADGKTAEPPAVVGTLTVPGLAAGKYRVVWWDTRAGRKHSEAAVSVAVAGQPLKLTTPAVAQDLAAYVVPATAKATP